MFSEEVQAVSDIRRMNWIYRLGVTPSMEIKNNRLFSFLDFTLMSQIVFQLHHFKV